MKIVFFGTDDFAAWNLEALINSTHQVSACVTQPDRARDRGLKMTASLVKTKARENKIPVLHPPPEADLLQRRIGLGPKPQAEDDLKDVSFVSRLKDYHCDLFVVIAYGKILDSGLLNVPRICAVNVHGSLLPKYRGAAPINWAIINGETETGVSIIKMNQQMDAGDILAQAKIKIEKEDTAVTLRAKMAELGADCLCRTMDCFERGDVCAVKQDSREVSLAPKLTKELGLIDWNKPAVEIHNLVRGLLPWPTAYTRYNGKLLKILETEIILTNPSSHPPGTVACVSRDGFVVATGKGDVQIKRVHPQSAKAMDAGSFVAGHKIVPGYCFGK